MTLEKDDSMERAKAVVEKMSFVRVCHHLATGLVYTIRDLELSNDAVVAVAVMVLSEHYGRVALCGPKEEQEKIVSSLLGDELFETIKRGALEFIRQKEEELERDG